MPYEITYDAEKGYVHCRVTGTIDLDLVRGLAGDIAPLMAEMACDRVLNDLSEAAMSPDLEAISQVPELLAAAGYDPDWRRAIVIGEYANYYSFYETLSQDQGHSLRVFASPDEALEWLLAT